MTLREEEGEIERPIYSSFFSVEPSLRERGSQQVVGKKGDVEKIHLLFVVASIVRCTGSTCDNSPCDPSNHRSPNDLKNLQTSTTRLSIHKNRHERDRKQKY